GKINRRPRDTVIDCRRDDDLIPCFFEIGRSRCCVNFSSEGIHAQRQMSAVLFHHPDRQDHERLARASDFSNFSERYFSQLAHRAPPINCITAVCWSNGLNPVLHYSVLHHPSSWIDCSL